MLTAIKKIKGLGVFSDFTAPADLPALKRLNVIYGDNGSGKTTLSGLFSALTEGGHSEFPDLDYVVQTETGSLAPGQKCPHGIRVFNADYVHANIGRFDGPIRPILVVGEENRALAAEVREEHDALAGREAMIDAESKEISKIETAKGKLFTNIASVISEATSGSALRKYRKPEAEKAFAALTAPATYDDAAMAQFRATLHQKQEEPIAALRIPAVRRESCPEASIEGAAASFTRLVHSLVKRTAQSAAIERLVANPDIAAWVERGRDIHSAHGSKSCEFCGGDLSTARIQSLADHFSEEDQKLKDDINAAKAAGSSIRDAIGGITLAAKSAFYSELRDEWAGLERLCEEERIAVLSQIAALMEVLDRKLTERTVAFETDLSIYLTTLIDCLDKMVALIGRHNEKASDFEREKNAARAAIETHYLSSIAGQVAEAVADIKARQDKIAELTDGCTRIADERSLDALRASIAEKRSKISSAHVGSAKLSEMVATFLGRTDLTFESHDEGYRVLRRGKAAKRLSEGEKTAIAFVYFIVHLNDNDFNLADGIVVIDDPISSMDSSAIYQAFGFLKSAVKDAKQVILLTHNFDFLKLILNWFEHFSKKSSMFMLICAEKDGARESRITHLDKLLQEHPTEYHFLFKTLYHFQSDGTIQSCYHIPNIARKLLETFLEFHAPSNGGMWSQLLETDFDENKKAAILKFTNDNSHRTGKGFDPAIVAETQKTVSYLLEMIKTVAPKHYEGLEKLSA